jgi:adhesin HecA-like repeat protein
MKFPNADGTGGFFLKTNGSGVLSWAAASSYTPPDTQTNATQTTSNATPTNIAGSSYAVATSNAIQYEARIVARDVTNSASSSWRITGTFYNNGGTVSQQGSATIVTEQLSNAGLGVDLVISGTNVLVQVTGLAATTVNWRAFSSVISVT